MLYPFGAAVVWIVLCRVALGRRLRGDFARHLALACLGTIVGTAIVYAPVLVASGLGALTRNDTVSALPMPEFLDAVPSMLSSTWSAWTRDLPLFFSAACAVAFLVGVVLAHRFGRLPVAPAVGVAL